MPTTTTHRISRNVFAISLVSGSRLYRDRIGTRMTKRTSPDRTAIPRKRSWSCRTYHFSRLSSPAPIARPTKNVAVEAAPCAADLTTRNMVEATLFAAIALADIWPRIAFCAALFRPHRELTAIIGSIIATRLMQRLVLKECPQYKDEDVISSDETTERTPYETHPDDPRQTLFVRVLDALLDGGKSGVEVGLAIIPGVLIISTLVMTLTFGTDPDTGTYTGEAYQGTELLPLLAGKAGFVFKWLFGFNASELVAFPITALGTVGAALGLIPEMMSKGIIDSNAIAVFTAMGMCWSGFLSADAATLDSLGYRHFISRSFTCTFIGGIAAGIVTHWLFFFITYLIELI